MVKVTQVLVKRGVGLLHKPSFMPSLINFSHAPSHQGALMQSDQVISSDENEFVSYKISFFLNVFCG